MHSLGSSLTGSYVAMCSSDLESSRSVEGVAPTFLMKGSFLDSLKLARAPRFSLVDSF